MMPRKNSEIRFFLLFYKTAKRIYNLTFLNFLITKMSHFIFKLQVNFYCIAIKIRRIKTKKNTQINCQTPICDLETQKNKSIIAKFLFSLLLFYLFTLPCVRCMNMQTSIKTYCVLCSTTCSI